MFFASQPEIYFKLYQVENLKKIKFCAEVINPRTSGV